MKKLFPLLALLLTTTFAQAKIWRVNNNANIVADFNDANTAVNAAGVNNGDTIHIEASATTYGTVYLGKQLVIIGTGYLLDPANGGNAGLQANINSAKINGLYFYAGSSGTRVIGMQITYYPTMQADSINNITLEKCALNGYDQNSHYTRALAIRKCYIYVPLYVSNGGLKDGVVENCIFVAGINVSNFTTGCVIRNCTFDGYYSGFTVNNAYFANNIVNNNNPGITNSIVKNNFFANTPSLPAGAVNNSFNNTLSNLVVATGSNDAFYQLKAGSPAIAAGVTLLGYTPDCGAYGGPDPYKLSGIPGVPSIYQLTVPASIPLNTPSMNVTLSTRNNN